jgi:hypothetical protein
MDKLFFIISFIYDISPGSLQVDLMAEIEMTSRHTCLVRSIRRINSNESSLLPPMDLAYADGEWVHVDTGRKSNIAAAIGKAIDLYLQQYREGITEGNSAK